MFCEKKDERKKRIKHIAYIFGLSRETYLLRFGRSGVIGFDRTSMIKNSDLDMLYRR
jgi:hypothetical protein